MTPHAAHVRADALCAAKYADVNLTAHTVDKSPALAARSFVLQFRNAGT